MSGHLDPAALQWSVTPQLPVPLPAAVAAPENDGSSVQFPVAVTLLHAFASWAIHREGGLGDWLRSIETAASLIEAGAGVRQADLLLRHLAGEP